MVLLSYQLSAISYQLSLFYNYVTFIVIGDQASARSCAFNNCLVVRRKSAAQAAFQIAHPVGGAEEFDRSLDGGGGAGASQRQRTMLLAGGVGGCQNSQQA